MCEVCYALFKNRGSLLHHMSVHKGTTVCKVCGKLYLGDRKMARHLKVRAGEMEAFLTD